MISEANESMEVSPNNKKGRKIFLIVSAGVMLICLAAAAFVVFNTSDQRVERVLDFGTVMSGISVSGVDISGLTPDEAKSATQSVSKELLSAHTFLFNVNGEVHEYALTDLGLATDYEDVLAQALAFGHTGSFQERKAAYDQARSEGVTFNVALTVQDEVLHAALAQLKTELDQAPQDASAEFMPKGYSLDANGNPLKYEPDPKALADAHASGKDLERPNLVRIDAAAMPNPLRYQYWDNNQYVTEDYIPADANIARFFYKPEVTGLNVNTDAVFDTVKSAVSTGEFSEIVVPVDVTEAQVKLDDIKAATQLISSWTSSYRKHAGHSRVWNVSRMSSFVNASVINPGDVWSANDAAGPRTDSTARTIGWKKAAGLENGGTTQQVGGGVCQLGSTIYNAALRANLTIAEMWHHSTPSDYISKGLDATLNTGAQDLKLKNDAAMPVYLVSYVDPHKKTVTVEVYGQLPVDPEFGENIIYDFRSNNKGSRYGNGTSKSVYNTKTAPDGTVLSPASPVYVFSTPRAGTKIDVYKYVLSADGTQLSEKLFERADYKPVNGVTYYYWPATGAPANATPVTPPAETVPPA